MKKTDGLDLIVFDYDELIDAPGETELDQQRTLVRAAKSLAIELQCVVILISQLRKALNKEGHRDARKNLNSRCIFVQPLHCRRRVFSF